MPSNTHSNEFAYVFFSTPFDYLSLTVACSIVYYPKLYRVHIIAGTREKKNTQRQNFKYETCCHYLFSHEFFVLLSIIFSYSLTKCVREWRFFSAFLQSIWINRGEKNRNPPMCHYVSIAMSWEEEKNNNNNTSNYIKSTYTKIAKVVKKMPHWTLCWFVLALLPLLYLYKCNPLTDKIILWPLAGVCASFFSALQRT